MNISIDKKIEGEVQSFDQAFALIINVLDRRFGLEGRLWVSEGGRDIKQDHATFRGIGAVVLKKPIRTRIPWPRFLKFLM